MYGERSAQLDKLFEAMSVFQGDIDNVARTRQGEFGLYADLGSCWDSVRKCLKASGLCLVAVPVPYGQDGTLAINSILGHSSGQFIASTIPLATGVSLQELAGDATYARRIAMGALLGLAADWDDDGKQSKANHKAAKAKSVDDAAHKRRAIAALKGAGGDVEKVLSIYTLVDEQVAKGKMNAATKDELLEQFPMPEEVANA
jgi:hypothetical protein